jgi:hypothetical protein
MVFGIYQSKLVLGLVICAAAIFVIVTTGSVMAPPEKHRKMEITSNAFRDGQPIPSRYTCDDKNISPEPEISTMFNDRASDDESISGSGFGLPSSAPLLADQ